MRGGRDADLPQFASHAIGELVAITPSISGLCLFFVLKPQERGRIEAALRMNYESGIRPKGGSLVYVGPREARAYAVHAIRREWRAQIFDFLTEYAPGVFCEGDPSDLPTCELLVGENFPLFDDQADEGRQLIARLADVGRASWIFEEEEREEGMMFAPLSSRDEALENHAILAASRAVLEGSVHQLNHQAGDHRHVHGADYEFRETFGRWSILQMVSVYHQRINEARDQAARLFSSPWPLRVLKRLQRLTTTLGDTAIITREIEVFAETGMRAYRSGYELVARKFRPGEARLTLRDHVRGQLKLTAAALKPAGDELDSFIAAQGNLTNARANLQLQVIVFVFAIVSLVFGAVSGFEAGYNLWKDRQGPAAEEAPPAPISSTTVIINAPEGGSDAAVPSHARPR
ncbi:hypothetical protein DDF67_23950 [Caulobacter endophyticus]|uniref:Uncharacterized protein n=2 Tax=Caulobacter endophyticus TaxID=2172652 RepID=A0A2T9JEH0_9CAUL|nr:hypothetical protein DDF67_23950 [Caulobacter endophyticus]